MVIPALAVADPDGLPRPDGPAVQQWPDPQGRVRVAAYRASTGYLIHWPGVGRFFLEAGAGPVLAVPIPGHDDSRFRDAFDRFIVPLHWQLSGGEALHASAACWGTSTVAFCAASGTGKSTIAWGLGLRGHRILSDDGLLLDDASLPARVVPVSGGVRLRPESARHFGLASESRLVLTPAAPAPEASLAGVMVLARQGPGAPVVIDRLSGADALVAVLAHAHAVDPGSDAMRTRSLARFMALLDRTPVWQASFPTGLQRLTDLLDEIEGVVEASL